MTTNTLYTENFPHMSPAWSRIFNFVAERAEGSYIYTDDGRKLLDFTCIPSSVQQYIKEMGDPAGSDPDAARGRQPN